MWIACNKVESKRRPRVILPVCCPLERQFAGAGDGKNLILWPGCTATLHIVFKREGGFCREAEAAA